MSIRTSLHLAPSPLASSSRLTIPVVHSRLKSKSAGPPKKKKQSSGGGGYDASQTSTSDLFDARTQLMRRVLYPPDAYSPRSASPTGTYPPKYLDKLQATIPHPEVHETIESAWRIYKRGQRLEKEQSMQARFQAMENACDELYRISRKGPNGEPALVDQQVYEHAVARPNANKEPKHATDRKASEFAKWKDSRVDGLMPREIWVPPETKGSAWKYDWQRPAGA